MNKLDQLQYEYDNQLPPEDDETILACAECGEELSECEVDEGYIYCSECDSECRCNQCKENR